jgi:hypothetical protein
MARKSARIAVAASARSVRQALLPNMPTASDQGERPVTRCQKCRAAEVNAVALASNFVYLRCGACAFLSVIEERRGGMRATSHDRTFQRWRRGLKSLVMAAVPKCPACHRDMVRLLPSMSERTRADYYRCRCGHVWSMDRETGELICSAVPLPEKPDASPRD